MKVLRCSYFKVVLGKLWKALRAMPTTQQCARPPYGCAASAVPDLLAYAPESPCSFTAPETLLRHPGTAAPLACRRFASSQNPRQ